MSTEIKDPFDDDSALDDFDPLDSDDEFGGNSSLENSEGDDGLEGLQDEDQAEEAAQPAKPAKASTQASADQPKPFVKTPLGMAVIASCVAIIGVVGLGASGILSSASVQEIAEQAPVPMPSQPASFGDKVGLAASQPAPAIQPVAQRAPDAIQTSSAVAGVVEAQNPNLILGAIDSGRFTAPVAAPIQAEDSASVAELKASIRELKEQSMIVTRLVKDVSAAVDRVNKQQVEFAADVKGLKEQISKNVQAVAAAEQPKAAKAPAAKQDAAQPAKAEVVAPPKPASVTDGRTRLAGLQVIDTSQNGEMLIIKKASNGRIFTLYPDEVINWGGSRQKVTGIEKDGSIVLVGDKFFIDKVLETQKADPKPVRESAPRQVKRPSKPSQASSAKGYTLNAVYDENRSFGVVNDRGEFKTYKIGDNVDKLGTVTGLNPDGDLKVGNTVIKSVY